MSVGLVGSHRSGKSTLAKAYAEKAGLVFIETQSSRVFEKLGISPRVDCDFSTRMLVQNAILDDAIALYSAPTTQWITDRTPVDMFAYAAADISRANLNQLEIDLFMEYMRRCIMATNMFFSTLIIVQPGIVIVDDQSKAPPNQAYIEHLNSTMLGMMVDERINSAHFYIPRHMIDLDERIACLDFALGRVKERSKEVYGDRIRH